MCVLMFFKIFKTICTDVHECNVSWCVGNVFSQEQGQGKAVLWLLQIWLWNKPGTFPTFANMFTVCPPSEVMEVWGHSPFCGEDGKALTTRVSLSITISSRSWRGTILLTIKIQNQTIAALRKLEARQTFIVVYRLLLSPAATVFISTT